jgi:hypothetical protein
VNLLVLDHRAREFVQQLESQLQLRSMLSNAQPRCFQHYENEIDD